MAPKEEHDIASTISDQQWLSIPTKRSNQPEDNMMPKEEHDIASTISDQQWLSIGSSVWDDEEPLMQNSSSSIQSRTSHSTASSRPQSPSSSSSRPSRKRGNVTEYDLKNATDALVGSISAVINFLSVSGIPRPSCDQLQKNLELGRYFAVLNRVQDYIQCIPTASEDETMAKIHLAVSAWESLCWLKAVEYKRAYKHCFNLRYELNGNPQEIKQAIALQVKIAEQCTTCQKRLYLVQKWQRHLLNQTKRLSAIEPQGYQPIRCPF